ncbi:ABC transporter transmembrane domain-containing protein [Bacillus chungangensis]|uniref:ATP-binding cassette subfamily B protein n=1 Tax=Bacillus chungangensis TaxID=587633 RepID=A0ABT9X0L8_9BACI|nr:ABC transporter transmembrane domain-containing protein [Bacillus chungangensis]MDQ0178515.1 ATP-binding cassette subfamily B protein [Bacillus chungangensis]
MKVFIDLKWFFLQEKKSYLTGTILLSIVAFFGLLPPKIIGMIVDEISKQTLTAAILMKWIVVLIVTALIMYILRYYWRIMIFGSSVKLARQLRNRLYYHFTKMSSSFYQRYRTGDLMAHATNDLQAIQGVAGSGVLTLVDSLLTGGFVVIAMAATISWKLTLIALIPMPFMALLTNYYGSLLHKRFHYAQAAFSSLNDKVQESITGIKVIKTFGQEKEDIAAFRLQSEDVVKKNVAVARVDALFDPTISLIVGTSFFLSVAFGARFVLAGEMTIGELISFTAYLGLLIWPMLAFGFLFNIMERGRASYDRVEKLLSERAEIEEDDRALSVVPSGNIVYDIESFTYPNEVQPVLRNIHFELRKGETLGVVGKTGAGKTTLIKLLFREFEGIKGNLLFGGKNIQDYKVDRLREAIGYVPQDQFLFSATVGENIAFGAPAFGQAQREAVAKMAQIHNDILQFSEGYDTLVGERGVALSGGQRQRISIARALILNPEVLILDDALSAVDAKTEEAILHSLKQERTGKTTMITSHRLSAIKHADLILVMDQGTIVESGRHEELMEKEGWYQKMYMHQQLEELVEQGGKHLE